MNIEKLKYGKCPHFKKYGIGALRGAAYRSNYVQTCKYCKRKFRMNWALSFVVKIFLCAFYGIAAFVISTYTSQISTEVTVLFLLLATVISFYLIIRICPMEEIKDE